MRFEVPQCKKCCFCIPLRYGLLVWSYMMTFPHTAYLVFGGLFQLFSIYNPSITWLFQAVFTVGLLLQFGDYAFTMILIVAAHTKSIQLLQLYYTAGLVLAGVNFMWVNAMTIYFFADRTAPNYPASQICIRALFGVLYVVMQLYIVVLVRSEILKLEGNENYGFSNRSYSKPGAKSVEDGDTDECEDLEVNPKEKVSNAN